MQSAARILHGRASSASSPHPSSFLPSNSYDLTLMFANMGLPVIGLLCLILATWTTNVGNAYSGGIATVGIFKISDKKRPLVTFIVGALGIILALVGIMDHFSSFLSLLAAFVPPMAGVVIAWACGTAFAMIFTFFIPTINGIIVSMLVYFILCKVVKSPKANPFAKAAE